jgi:hypothetical protein
MPPASRMASASDHRAHAALQPADCLILLPQRLPAALETSIGPAHYPAECTQSDAFLQPSLRARNGRANSMALLPPARRVPVCGQSRTRVLRGDCGRRARARRPSCCRRIRGGAVRGSTNRPPPIPGAPAPPARRPRGYCGHLSVRVGPSIFRIRDQPIDCPPLDLVRRPRSLISAAISRAQTQ